MQNQSLCFTVESNNSYLSDQFENTCYSNIIIEQDEEQKCQLQNDIHQASKRLSHSADHYVKDIVDSIMFMCRKKFNLRKKWARYRKFVLQELVDSEFTYVKDLEFIIKNIFEPLQGSINEAILQKLFLNLRQIYLLNKQFLIEISERFNSFTQLSCFGKIFDKYVLFFKIYYEYTSNFSIDKLSEIRRDNQELDNFITDIEDQDIFSGKKLDAYLIKPVQRLPKYVLLLKDLIKHTWNTHPDYEQLQQSLVKFIEVNRKIDKLMDKVLKNQMLFELQKQFFEPININIVESTRRYIDSETLNVLVSKQQKSVIVHICNDMIILTQRNQNALIYQHEKLYNYIYLNDKSYCKNKPETEYCKHLFTVSSSEQSITLICSDAEQKQKLLKLFDDLISDLRKPQNLIKFQDIDVQPIKVYAKGTELRKTLFQSYTVYVMLISAGSQNLTLSTRYSSLINLELLLRQEYPDIVIPHLSKNQWMNNKRTQLIEARKIIIENFIEAVLNSPIVKANPEKVLKYLELPPSFYETITSSPCKMTEERESFRKTIKSSSFNADEMSLSDTMRFIRGSNIARQTMHHKSLKCNETINIKIQFMDDFYIFLPISPELRVAELLEMAAENVKLQSCYDFKLFILNGLETRILDDEDCIPQQENKQQSNQFFMNKLSILFKEKPKTQIQLLMKKYFYLSQKKEKKDFSNDLVRLNLICHQAFDDVKNLKFSLSFSQYCVYSTYYLIIKYYAYFNHTFTKQSLPINLVKQMIPDKIYKQEKETTWILEIFNAIDVVKKEIQQIIKQNDNNLGGFKKQEQQYQYITSLLFMESISQNEFYGLQLFQIEIINQTKDLIFKQYNIQVETFCTLGIRYDKFIIIHNLKKMIEIPITQIVNTQPFPFSFQFELLNNKDTKLCFKTTNGLEIQKLYEIYLDISKNLLE